MDMFKTVFYIYIIIYIIIYYFHINAPQRIYKSDNLGSFIYYFDYGRYKN